MNTQAAAGWYHAEGDPVGTLRYWDGGQWVGEPQYPPQPAVADPAPFQPAPSGPDSWAPSPWSGSQPVTRQQAGIGARFLAYLLDGALVMAPFLVLSIIGGDEGSLGGIGVLLLFGLFLWNSVYRQGTTGQTVGKTVLNIELLGADDGRPIGIGKALGRAVLSRLFNAFLAIDYIWALIDRRNQRIVDKILTTNVFSTRHDR